MCFPKWHGTDNEGTLFAVYYEHLNEHALFNSREEAQEFLDFYRSFDWTETGDYVIAEICLPEELPNKTLQTDRLTATAELCVRRTGVVAGRETPVVTSGGEG